MANKKGSVNLGLIQVIPDSVRGGKPAAVQTTVTQLGGNQPIYKNTGYYTAGSVYEVWTSTGSPSVFNPATGHGPLNFSTTSHELVK